MNQQNDLYERLRAALDAVMNHQWTGDRARMDALHELCQAADAAATHMTQAPAQPTVHHRHTSRYHSALAKDLEAQPPAQPVAQIDAEVEKSWARLCLENCRLFAARHRKEEWARTILRFCAEGGATGSPLRTPQPQVEDARDAVELEVIAQSSHKDSARQWVNFGVWLYPGERIVHERAATKGER
jgi:hypothetical protein